jgi:TfoX/Sxy family transcriptional regulator of competence genes
LVKEADQQTVERLEEKLKYAIAEVVIKMGLKKLPLLPSQRTMHLMAKAAVAVYEAVAVNHGDFSTTNRRTESRMAFDEVLAERIRQRLARKKGVDEKKMFGGIGFLLNGNLLVGVWKDSLIARIGRDEHEDALLEPHVKEFDITSKPMKAWVLVEPAGIVDDEQLHDWIQRAVKFVGKLPAK